MKKIKKALILFVILPFVELFTFFTCCNCDNFETEYKTYIYESLSLKNLDNTGEYAVETDAEEVNRNAYGMRLFIMIEEPIYSNVSTCRSLFSTANAFACDCSPGVIYSPRTDVSSIKIYTLNDFNDEKSKNSDISEYFKVADYYCDVKDWKKYTDVNFTEELMWGHKVDFLLMTPPAEKYVNHRFKISISLSNGQVLECETEIALI